MGIANFLQVIIGAALGASLRYIFVLFLPFPILLVNVLGSLLIGFVHYKFGNSESALHEYIPLISIGALGSFTTFSSYSLELVNEINSGQILKASYYAIGTPVLCIIACFLGYKLANCLS